MESASKWDNPTIEQQLIGILKRMLRKQEKENF